MVDQRKAVALSSQSFKGVLLSWRIWWRDVVRATVDQSQVIEARREEALMSARYLFMLMMSAGIAVLGLLLSSPAVVIGAMLLSPLMGPIIGLGFALATGDFRWMRQASRSLVIGTVLSIVFCALIVMVSPLQTVTPEIASRTRPNLFDLMVALFSALAGAYAMIRGREGTVVGVAIATALMPPLAVVGFGLATWNWTVFSGALLLYVTNLVTIALFAMFMARLYGFRTTLSEKQTQLQTGIVIIAFIALAVPLALSLRQIGWEANASRLASSAIKDSFDSKARVSDFNIDFNAEPIIVSATVLTPQIELNARERAMRELSRTLGTTVDLNLEQFQVGTSATAAEAAEIAAASRRDEQASEAQVEDITELLALVSGVARSDVLVDRENRRASVKATALPNASLQTWRELERRIASRAPDWRIQLDPPAAPLSPVTFGEDGPDEAGSDAIAVAVWAARRIDAPIVLTGAEGNVITVAERLRDEGVRVVTRPQRGGGDNVTLAWASPDAAAD